MSFASLRLRLLLLAALLVAAAVVLAGIALLLLFGTHLERRVGADLEANLNRAVALIIPEAEAPTLRANLADPRYALPLSGLYWEIEDLASGAVLRSPSLVDAALDAEETDEGLIEIEGPGGQVLVAVSRLVRFPVEESERAYRVTVAEDRSVIDRSIIAFGGEMSIALLLLALVLTCAGTLQVYLGLRPLETVRARVERVRLGEAERLEGAFPDEIVPLVREVNDLLEARDKSIDFARARAADLAHGLKTPLAVLAATANRAREAGDEDTARFLEELCEEMDERIDYQLRLARLRLRPESHVMTASLKAAVLRIALVLKKTHAGELIDWELQLGPDVAVNLDQQDLIELVGVVLENACQWAESRVRIGAMMLDGFVELSIEDDGVGLTREQMERIGERGQRLDETRRGTGLGMAIAKEIVALNRGAMTLERSQLGGLAVRLRLPVSPGPGGDAAAG
ncbi:HAMP domain-containing histidine kinase [Arsenicitalea aurantiaca]|uniref:histidine kinase n=1 Tax=Arsenicitalea aurantiaca TaxID=1783274 RepID=A0A433XAK6_9HYPH|nr:sensor histidine kinase [Arsenicitalea aurantiaca]RUT31093.1 HAMP domain-containing histidine kinase [Arsenicitalea aurantiaca]